MTSTKTKAAKDGAEFEAYPTYSMAVLWSLNAQSLNDSVTEDLVEPTALDGDALARCAGNKL